MGRFTVTMITACLWFLVFLAGCGSSGGSAGTADNSGKTASVALAVDLQALGLSSVAKSVAGSAVPPITSATVELTRTDYLPISKEMTISNNVASCRIDNLAVGYWHVTVHIFSYDSEMYSGTQDANLIAGAVTQVNILFDPVITPVTTGSLAITATLNPLPGYSAINQQITKIFFDDLACKIYIYDATTKTIGVYAADTMIRERDITLISPPVSIAFTSAKDAMLLGYTSGQVYKLDLATGGTTLIGDVLMEIQNMVALDNRIVLLLGPDSLWDSAFKTLDLTTGQVLSSKSYYYPFGDLVLNQANGVVYAQDINVSPVDLFRIKTDLTTGTITEISDSPYHGDYYLGQPIRIINNGSRLVVASGVMFTSSLVSSQDLLYSGNIGISFIDLTVDNAKNRYYLLNNNSPYKLISLNQSNYFVDLTVDLLGTPKMVFTTTGKIIVITSQSGSYYAKVFDKAELGL